MLSRTFAWQNRRKASHPLLTAFPPPPPPPPDPFQLQINPRNKNKILPLLVQRASRISQRIGQSVCRRAPLRAGSLRQGLLEHGHHARRASHAGQDCNAHLDGHGACTRTSEGAVGGGKRKRRSNRGATEG